MPATLERPQRLMSVGPRRASPYGLWHEPRTPLLAVLLSFPAGALLLLIVAYPLAYEVYLSLHRVGIHTLRTGEARFVGYGNFLGVLQDSLFQRSLWNTAVFSLFSVVGSTTAGLVFALLMNRRGSVLSRFARVMVLVPWAVPPIAAGMMWSFIYNPKYGYLNALALRLGLTDSFINVLGDPRLAMWAVISAYVWRVMPFAAVLLYAALQTIPDSLYEAARIDGANDWWLFRHVTLPLLRPAIAVVLVLRTTFAFVVFDEVLAITGGGPGNDTWTVAFYSYVTSFRYFEFGPGAASALLLGAIIAVVALFYIKGVYVETEPLA